MNVFLFPGQGSQEVGMAADLFRSDAAFRDLVDLASTRVGADLGPICLRGPARELERTRYLQPLLVCVSLGYLRRLVALGIEADMALGHSLGEITALAAAKTISFQQAVEIAVKRGELMDQAAAASPGTMTAVTTPNPKEVLALAGECVLANDNAPSQVVLSGRIEAIDQVAQRITETKVGRCRRLAVAGAWHSPSMNEAALEFEQFLQSVPFQSRETPIIFNGSAAPEADPDRSRTLVAQNLNSPVRWRESMDTVRALRPGALFEIGPGRTLAGLARANGFGVETQVYSINSLRGVDLASSAAISGCNA